MATKKRTRTSSFGFAKRTKVGNKVTYSSNRSGASITADLSTKQGRATQRSVRRAGARGAVLGFATTAPFALSVVPPIATSVAGRNRAQNVRIEKLAAANKLKNTTKKGKSTQRTSTKAHAGKVGSSAAKSKARGGSRKKKTNWAKGADGKFIGSR